MKFLVDRCAGKTLADWLKTQGHDAIGSWEGGTDPGDRALLEIAFQDERVLITIDKDFGQFLFLERMPHRGLIRLPDVPVAPRIELMGEILLRQGQDLREGAVLTVRGGRLRISRPHHKQ